MDSRYLKNPQESEYEYGLRLIGIKKSESPEDLDWSDVVDLIKLDLNKDSLRKSQDTIYGGYAVAQYYKKKQEEAIMEKSEDSIIKEYEQKINELQKERIKVSDQKREYRNILRQDARADGIKDFIEQTAKDMSKEKPFEWTPINKSTGTKEGVLLISDWHSEMEVKNFLNVFNKEEFKRRINRLVLKTIEHGKANNIKILHVLNLNDLISGIIHITTRLQNNEDVVSQTMFVSEIISDMLVKFATEFETVNFISVLDNHSRVSPDKKESIDTESFARFIPWYVKARVSDVCNINIINNELDDDIAIFNVCGFTCFGVHGNKDSVSNVVQNLTLMTRRFADYIFMSHYHHNIEDEIHSCEVIVNPSLVGTDTYSKDIRKSSKPVQKFVVFSPEEGRECTFGIRLDI